jgi:CRISPR-associated protein Cmr3
MLLQPRDPILVRDGRPFSAEAGARAMTQPWVLPQTLAGAMRTCIGTAAGFDWSSDGPDRARRIGVRGPLLVGRTDETAAWTPYVPAPFDAVPYATETGALRIRCRRPVENLPAGAGCDLPHPLLRPPVPVESQAGKRYPEIAFWSLDDAMAGLSTPVTDTPPRDWLRALPRETRVHVRIDPATKSHVEGALFTTTSLVFADVPRATGRGAQSASSGPAVAATAILCRVEDLPDEWQPEQTFLALGGERRMASIGPLNDLDHVWARRIGRCVGTRRLRLQLVTPALFGGGWRPGWVDAETLEGAPPGLPDLRLRLVSAVVDRRVAISGWDLQHRRPRRVRYAAPAGSVYFFETLDDDGLSEQSVDDLWLRAVSDDAQDRRDGFGLVLPGVW